MKFFPSISILVLLSPICTAQNLDSLWAIWQDNTQHDTIRLNAMHNYAKKGYLFSQPDSAFYFAGLEYKFAKNKGCNKQMAAALNTQGVSLWIQGDYENAINYHTKCLKIQVKIGNKQGVANSLGNIGNIYKEKGDYENAINYFLKCLKIFKDINDSEGTANALGNIGNIYMEQGNYAQAINNHIKSLKIKEEIGNKQGISISLNDIGNIYFHQKNYNKAIEYYTQSLRLKEEIGSKQGIAISLSNIGNCYYEQNENLPAIDFLNRSLKIFEEIGNKQGISATLNNIGSIYQKLGDYAKAMDYYTNCLRIKEEIGNKQGIALSLNAMGNLYFKQGNSIKALDLCKRALNISKEIGAITETEKAAQNLWEIYKNLGRHQQALEMYELYIQMRDSILSEENQKEIIRQEYKYEYEKKEALAAADQEKKDAIAREELKKQTLQRNGFIGGFILMLALAGVVFRSYRNKQKANVIITQQKQEVEQQKHLIEEKHKEITDSINYAERIQRSFLATREMLDENLRDYFVFFKPKDVVSGDFYWAAQLNNGCFAFTVADSTGHGVPGAIMSILNISSLEKSIETQTEPHNILFETRKIIINRLKKDGSPEGGKDGMDCSLLVLNQDKTQLSFASAHNPVFILRTTVIAKEERLKQSVPKDEIASLPTVVRNDGYELIEFKGDKIPVGKHDRENEPFTLHTITLQKGDVIYALTDGFPDQFGGDKGKKYMIKNLKVLLLQIAHLPMCQQEQKLSEEFDRWKGSNEQVDDVCIIGVRV